MNELIPTIQNRDIPENWDYDESVKWMKPRITIFTKQWNEIEPKLRKAREILSTDWTDQERKPDGTFVPPDKTWADYCDDIGMSKRHANRLLLKSEALVSKFTGDQENYTPREIIIDVKKVLGKIDLDPASCLLAQEIIQAENFFTEENDGLNKKWYGNVFLNPPYQQPMMNQFIDKLIEELPNISNAILLTNNNTDTNWFYNCAINAKSICFTKGRINFYTENIDKTYPTNGQSYFYYGTKNDTFVEVFKHRGLIMEVVGVD